MSLSPQHEKAIDWRLPILLGALFLVVATPLLGRKLGYTVDATPSFQLTQAMVENGDLFPAVAVKQGYLYSLLYAPFYALGGVIAPLFPGVELDWVQRKLLCWMNLVFGALTVAIFSQTLAVLGFRRWAQAGAALMLAFASLLFFYARTDYNKTVAGFWLMASFYALVRWHATNRLLYASLAGVFTGLLIMIRAELGIVLPVYCAFIALTAQARMRIAALAALSLPTALGVFFVLGYNYAYWGGSVAGGYEGGFVLNPLPALSGFLVSPGKSLLVFNPALLLLPLLLRPFMHSVRKRGWLWLAVVIAVFGLYCHWGNWWGGWGYGPRHLAPLLPLLMLPLAAAFEMESKPLWLTAGVLGLAGFVVQCAGMLIDFNDILLMLIERQGFRESQVIWRPAANQILHHVLGAYFIDPVQWDIGWMGLIPLWGTAPVALLFLLWVVTLGVLAFWIQRCLRASKSPTST